VTASSQTSGTAFVPNVELELAARAAQHPILPGRPTQTWSYAGKLLKGRAGTLQPAESYLGPTIRVRRGDKLRIHFRNDLPEPSIVHWHGLEVPELADGHPRFAIPQGRTYVYEFEVRNRAGQYWYHPHPMGRTGAQVYQGMAGLFFVEDDEEQSLQLPSAEHEIPIVLQDRTFDANSQLVYTADDNIMEAMTGFLGDRIVVNGRASYELPLATTVYRLRVLNGSNSRIYKLAWSDKTPVTLIGTDGGLLERAASKSYLALAPGERADLILDLRQRTLGATIELRSLAFSGAQSGMGMMGRGMRSTGSALGQGDEFSVLRVRVTRREASSFRMPERLSQLRFQRAEAAINRSSPRVFPITFRQMRWLVNNDVFRMTEVADNEVVKSGSLEVWEFRNMGSGMMQMAHPMHLHGGQFQVLERFPASAFEADRRTLSAGFTDEGWKDVVLVWPGERVRLLMKFGPFKGLFLYHCHNLEHEDLGLMRNFRLI
jgi:FtsP/CotA-like multicopper oxidase with cupredoxin domain